ncbi:basic proline-rich protein-like [Falco cherrug]|uniref:basic proline-rich protein-like n=1 Tax=Falco cherrug TaxID=345164 RepID=UPI00247AEDDF|nr:basic proline-rich protein-like [Falco cherrug]
MHTRCSAAAAQTSGAGGTGETCPWRGGSGGGTGCAWLPPHLRPLGSCLCLLPPATGLWRWVWVVVTRGQVPVVPRQQPGAGDTILGVWGLPNAAPPPQRHEPSTALGHVADGMWSTHLRGVWASPRARWYRYGPMGQHVSAPPLSPTPHPPPRCLLLGCCCIPKHLRRGWGAALGRAAGCEQAAGRSRGGAALPVPCPPPTIPVCHVCQQPSAWQGTSPRCAPACPSPDWHGTLPPRGRRCPVPCSRGSLSQGSTPGLGVLCSPCPGSRGLGCCSVKPHQGASLSPKGQGPHLLRGSHLCSLSLFPSTKPLPPRSQPARGDLRAPSGNPALPSQSPVHPAATPGLGPPQHPPGWILLGV